MTQSGIAQRETRIIMGCRQLQRTSAGKKESFAKTEETLAKLKWRYAVLGIRFSKTMRFQQKGALQSRTCEKVGRGDFFENRTVG